MMRGQQLQAGPAAGQAAQGATLAPQLDRSKAILWLGGTLIAVNYVTRAPATLGAVFGGTWSDGSGAESSIDLVLQAAMLGALYLGSRLSDVAGTAAVVFLSAIWVVFIWRHAAGVEQFIGRGGIAPSNGPSPSSKGSNQ